MRIFVLLSLFTLGVTPVASKLRSNNGVDTSSRPRKLQDRATFQSFFDIDYLTNGTKITNFTMVAQALADAYNDLVKQGYNDPYNRTMETVEVLDTSTTTQSPNSDLNAFLRVTGRCDGCPNDSEFTVDVRRRNLKSSKKSSKSSGSSSRGKGGKGESDKIEKSVKSQNSKGKGHSRDIPKVPTEEELRVAYAAAIKRLQNGIVDVVRLDEVDSIPHEPEHPTDSGSSDERPSKGGSSGKGSVDCPAIGGSFSGTFTSYFMATYELVKDSNDDVPAAVEALSTAYNKVLQRYEADITMEKASIYDPASGRRLSFEEVEMQRKLQYLRSYYISVSGRCNGCSRTFTTGNQLKRGRKLSSWGQCLLPGLPSEDELNTEYNVELDRLNLPNVIGCRKLDEVNKPVIPSGKGGGKGGSDSSTGKSKSGKGDTDSKSGKGGKGDKSTKSAKSEKSNKSGKRTRR